MFKKQLIIIILFLIFLVSLSPLSYAEVESLIPERITASSVLPTSKAGNYIPENVLSPNPSTAWVKGTPGDGVGESLVFYFTNFIEFDSIKICNGYQKSESTYANNSRIKTFYLIFPNGEKQLFTIQDKMSCFDYSLRGKKGSSVKLLVESVYPGSKWQDLAISYIQFFGSTKSDNTIIQNLNATKATSIEKHNSSTDKSAQTQNLESAPTIVKNSETPIELPEKQNKSIEKSLNEEPNIEKSSRPAQASATSKAIEPSKETKEDSFLDKIILAILILLGGWGVKKTTDKKDSSKNNISQNSGTISPRFGGGPEWRWNGKTLRPRFGGGTEWRWDGKTLSPRFGGATEWRWDGKTFSARHGNATQWSWDGKKLSPRHGNATEWSWDGKSFSARRGTSTIWKIEGDVPLVLVAGAIAAGILKNE